SIVLAACLGCSSGNATADLSTDDAAAPDALALDAGTGLEKSSEAIDGPIDEDAPADGDAPKNAIATNCPERRVRRHGDGLLRSFQRRLSGAARLCRGLRERRKHDELVRGGIDYLD